MPRRNKSQPIPVRKPSPCAKKHQYSSQTAAERAIDKVIQVNGEAALRAYFCTHCGQWHLTTQTT